MRDVAQAAGKFALRDFQAREHPAGGAQDGFARRIIEGDTQIQGAPAGRETLGEFDRVHQRAGNAVAAAHHAQTNTFGGARGRVSAQIIFQEIEQGDHLARGTPPVVGRKCVERERANAERGGGANYPTHGGNTGTMSFGPGKTTQGGPTAVAIQEYCDVKFRLRERIQSTFVHRVWGQKNFLSRIESIFRRRRFPLLRLIRLQVTTVFQKKEICAVSSPFGQH